MSPTDPAQPPPLTPQPDLRPIVAADPVPAIDHAFRQAAHRAMSLAVWLFVGRLVLACWPRTFDFAPHLLIATFVCLDVTIATAFMSYCVARHRNEHAGEPKELLIAALVLLIPTVTWIVLPRLAAALPSHS